MSQHAPAPAETVEVRHFDVDPRDSMIAIRRAIERAAALELRTDAPGLWRGERAASWWGKRLALTVRASETNEGTQIVLVARHRTPPALGCVAMLLLFPLAMLVLPMLILPVLSMRAQERQRDDRETLLHRVWGELAITLGAPFRATYRDAPARVLPDEIEIGARSAPRVSAG